MGIDFNQIIEAEGFERLELTSNEPESLRVRSNESLFVGTVKSNFVKTNTVKMAEWLNSLDNIEFRRVIRHLETISKIKGV